MPKFMFSMGSIMMNLNNLYNFTIWFWLYYQNSVSISA